jgi:hypothetical protein
VRGTKNTSSQESLQRTQSRHCATNAKVVFLMEGTPLPSNHWLPNQQQHR